jgi:hypothetical protein
MSTSQNYQPRYTSIDRVPVSGKGQLNSENSYKDVIKSPDMDDNGNLPEVSHKEILDAIQDAESYLEDRVNDGLEIDNVRRTHEKACAIIATYELLRGLDDASFARIADVADMDDTSEFLDRLWDDAENWINAIEMSESTEGSFPARVININGRET